MASTNENLPEVAHGASYPQVHQQLNLDYQPLHQQHQDSSSWSPHQSTAADSTDPSQYLHHVKSENYQSYPQVVTGADRPTHPGHDQGSDEKNGRDGRTMLRGCCPPIVLVLSVVIAVLSALVVGLAAGTGVAANNYRSEQNRFRDLQASYSSLVASRTGSASASASPTGAPDYSKISNGCSEDNESTTGTFYRPDFFGKPRFTMYCNKDAANTPLYSLFTADFNTCMSACASWNSYNASANGATSCEAVSFIPLWSDLVMAVKGKAPGDCYLKPGPQSVTKLQTPNIGTECHAAILENNSTAKG
ncbi:hypothetical protein E4U55_005552 [Claviceps digitariae]|nr:hypothetical protein E4U55_005552 [Claviceps digitariae]